MSIALTSGRKEPCNDAVGGLSKVFFLDYVEDAFTVSAGEATALNAAVTVVYEYQLRSNLSNLQEVNTGDTATGTYTSAQTLNLTLKKIGKATSEEMKLVAKARPIAVGKDSMGNYRVVGLKDGILNAVITTESGIAKTDFNGYNIVLTALEDADAPFLDAATITALEAVVSATYITP